LRRSAPPRRSDHAKPGEITGADLLRIAASDPNISHDTLAVLADTIDGD
jgi:hypothetical protein